VTVTHTHWLWTGYEMPERGPCVPLRCPIAGTLVVPLVPLVRFLGDQLALPSPSCWLLRTIRLGYAIHFARRTPKFRGVHFTSVEAADAPVLSAEIATLLVKDAIQPAPPADMKAGSYSPYFIVPMKDGGLRPILDLRVLNWALHRLPFKMLMQKQVCPDRPEGHVLSCFNLTGVLSLLPCVSTEVMEADLVPLREQGICTLNYINDWLILAQSQDQLCEHRDLVLAPQPEKSKLSQTQRISFLGIELDSERAQMVLNCLNTFESRMVVPLKWFQRAYGSYSSGHATSTASTLAPQPSPEVGVAVQHSLGQSDTSLPPDLHPVVKPYASPGR
ncbi:hypothetical protein M9458_029555, partial [Cirrhinus mrigala]